MTIYRGVCWFMGYKEWAVPRQTGRSGPHPVPGALPAGPQQLFVPALDPGAQRGQTSGGKQVSVQKLACERDSVLCRGSSISHLTYGKLSEAEAQYDITIYVQ